MLCGIDICNMKVKCSTVFEISHTQKYMDGLLVRQLILMAPISDLVGGAWGKNKGKEKRERKIVTSRLYERCVWKILTSHLEK